MLRDDFQKAAARAEGLDINGFIEAIREERPDLKGQIAYAPEQGACAHTVLIGDEVFKASKIDKNADPARQEYLLEGIERERAILQRLQGSGLLVPEVTYQGKALPFFGMTRLPGVELDYDDLKNMSPADQEELAEEIAAVCATLSEAISEQAAAEMNADKPFPGVSFTAEVINEALTDPEVTRTLGNDEAYFRQGAEAFIAKDDAKPEESKKLFMHGDMNRGNILIDPLTKKMTGLIDFGAARMTSVEEGFSGLYFGCPPPFVDKVLKAFSRLKPEQAVTMNDMRNWECAYAVNRVATLAHNKPKDWEKTVKFYLSTVSRQPADLQPAAPVVRSAAPKIT